MLWREKCTQNQNDRERERVQRDREPNRTSHTITHYITERVLDYSVPDHLIEVCAWIRVSGCWIQPHGIGDDKRQTTEVHTCSHWDRKHKCAKRHVACLYTLEIGQKCLRTAVPATNSNQNQNNLLFLLFFVHTSRHTQKRSQNHLTLASRNDPTRCREMAKSVRCVCARYHLMVSNNRKANIVFSFGIADKSIYIQNRNISWNSWKQVIRCVT